MKKIVQIDVKDLEEDMQLASDAIDEHGVCLLSVGSIISKNMINGLVKRGIDKVSIYHIEELTPEQIQECISNIQNELDCSFQKVETLPKLKQLKQVFFEYRTKDLNTNND